MKQQIREYLEIDWVTELDGLTKRNAILWLQENITEGSTLYCDYYNESSSLLTTRLETDAEEVSREEREKEIARQAIITLKGDIQNIKDVIYKLQQEDVVPTDNIRALEGCIVKLEGRLFKKG